MKRFLLLMLFLTVQQTLHAQHVFQVSVKDSLTHELLTGATVIEQGTTNATATDANGTAQLSVSKSGAVQFTIQFIGYITKHITVIIPQVGYQTVFLSADNHELEEVTVTLIRTNSRIEDIPTRVEVLGLDDMNEENGVKPGNIMSLLGDIAGIQMQQVSASSGNTYARIQGLNGRYTQLLRDGMPLFGGLSGSFGIMQIPPLDLKQIEIIKGSASTLYGGDAIGGIINLVSKDPSYIPELSITVNQSSLLETNVNAYYAQRFKKTGLTFFAGQTFQKQMDIDNDGLSDIAHVNSTVIHPKLIIYFNPESTLTFNYTGTIDNRQGGNMDFFHSSAEDTLYHVTNTIIRHTANAKYLYEFSGKNNITIKLNSNYLTQNLSTKEYAFDATQLIYYSEIAYFHQLDKMNWVTGVNFNGDHFNNQSEVLTTPADYNYQTIGGFVQNTWTLFKKLTVESGFRGDYHSRYGLFALPHLSLLYKFNTAVSARINGGYGYKTPNIITYIDSETDLNRITSDINLNSEISQGLNADLNYHKLFYDKLNVTFNQSFFFTTISRPVYDSSSVTNQISLLNADKDLQTRGLQSYARIKYSAVELYLGYVFTDVFRLYDDQHKHPFVTPRHNFAATLFYEPGEHWRFGIESSMIAGQTDENYKPVNDYILFAAMIQYNVRKMTFVLNGENLLDFRQNSYGRIYTGTINNPVFHKLWAPIDGRVINLSVKWSM